MAKRIISNDKRGFKGVWIPAQYWLDEDLTMNEVLFITEIDSLCQGSKGCFASNSHFAEFFGITRSRCSQIIKGLIEKEYLTFKYDRKPSGQITCRHLWVVNKLNTPIKNSKGGYLENAKGSNTTKSNTKDKTSCHKSKIYDDDSPYMILSNLLLKWMRSNNPKYKRKPNLQSWSDEIRKLNQLDGQSLEDVKRVIVWSQKDSFWSTNILSGKKLRDQFDVLYRQMTRDDSKGTPSEPPMSDEARMRAEEAKRLQERIEAEKENSAKEREAG